MKVSENTEPKKRERKLTTNWTSEKTERLIQEVKAREGTWNFASKEYQARNWRVSLWQEVADAMELPRKEVSTKWNSLRCSFRTMYNNMVYTKSGQRGRKQPEVHHLYNALKFLEPTLQIDEHPNPTSKLECLYSADSPDPLSDAGSNLEHEDIKPTLTTNCIERNDDQCANNMEHDSETTAAKHDTVDDLDPENSKPFPTTIKKASLETITTAAKHDTWDDLDLDDSKPTSTTRKASAKRRCIEQNDKQSANATERALETTTTVAKHDTWDDLGKFVASNGREWAAENLKLAKKFKTDIYELVLNYQKQMT